jgi:UDP-2,3-diacylglucosamine hydrolase
LAGQRTYFASDFHLGLAADTDPREREARVITWLEEASHDAQAFYLLGDIFDFWWEYSTVVPKGFTRFLGTLSSLTDELFYLAHGEGLGSRSPGNKLLFAFFRNRVAQFLFSALHPRIGIALGNAWSKSSRLAKHVSLPFLGEDREDLICHTRKTASGGCKARFYIYGHRHLPLTFDEEGRRMIILGDWFSCRVSYAVYDGKELVLVNEILNP